MYETLYFLEYSPSQDAFHRSTLKEVLSNNLQSLANGEPTDYVIVGVFTDIHHSVTYAEHLRKNLFPKFGQGAPIDFASLAREATDTPMS